MYFAFNVKGNGVKDTAKTSFSSAHFDFRVKINRYRSCNKNNHSPVDFIVRQCANNLQVL